jgi:8-oxo-dGTP pyrophosphatase MutT (NUDIX family)
LFRGGDPHRPEIGTWWFTPGGGVEEGESLVEAARREVFEETGIELTDVGPQILRREVRVMFEGVEYDKIEHFFAVLVDVFDPGPVDVSGWTDVERRSVVEQRWWTVAELRATDQTFYPVDLPDLVEAMSWP